MNYANFTRFSPEYVIPFNSFQSDSCNDSSSVVRQNGEPQNGCAYMHQGVRNVRFSENLACFVFLKNPFWYSPFCLIAAKFFTAKSYYFRKVLYVVDVWQRPSPFTSAFVRRSLRLVHFYKDYPQEHYLKLFKIFYCAWAHCLSVTFNVLQVLEWKLLLGAILIA